MEKFIKVNLDSSRRIIMISDIHGEKDLLIKLLNKVKFNDNDYLFLLGDFVGKGKDSLNTLRYIMDLSQKENVFLIVGNCDLLFNSFSNEKESIHLEAKNISKVVKYYHSLIGEMLWELGIDVNKVEDFTTIIEPLYKNFGREFAFLRTLPRVIETEEFIFVHSAISGENYQNDSDYSLMRTNNFSNVSSTRFKKYVVVGHYPTINYCEKIPKLNPLFNYQKNIISIDGGLNTVEYGQLNALVYDKKQFNNYYVDKLDIYQIKKDYFPYNEKVITINYMNNKVDIIEEKNDFYKCYHPYSQTFIDIDKNYVYKRNDSFYSLDTTNYHLEVIKGDFIHLIRQYKDYSLVKKAGIVGYIKNDCIGSKINNEK